MDAFFSSLAMGLFGQTTENEQGENGSLASGEAQAMEEESLRKRARRGSAESNEGGTPTLVSVGVEDEVSTDSQPVKRRRGIDGKVHQIVVENERDTESEGDRTKTRTGDGVKLTDLPEDLISNCLSFLGGVEDRFALQCTSKQFQRISNSDEMLIGIQVGGDKVTGLHGIVSEKDTPITASDNLAPFALAGNLEAIYM